MRHAPRRNNVESIIAKHGQADVGNGYWYKKLEAVNTDQAHQLVREFDPRKRVGQIYNTYYQKGMTGPIPAEMSSNIREVMNFIKAMAVTDTGMSDKTVEVTEKLFFTKEIPQHKIVDVHSTELLAYRQIGGGNDRKSTSLNRILSIPEVDIKTIAVSILAETGDVKLARQVLSTVGTQVMKGMNNVEMSNLKSDLQSISTQTEPNSNER